MESTDIMYGTIILYNPETHMTCIDSPVEWYPNQFLVLQLLDIPISLLATVEPFHIF